jgi:lanthanide-dependent methanol dehydrogenase
MPAMHTQRAFVGALLVLPVFALANANLEKQMSNPKNWAAQAGDMKNHRYSV